MDIEEKEFYLWDNNHIVKCEYCKKSVYAWQRWSKTLNGCAHYECMIKAGIEAGEKMRIKE